MNQVPGSKAISNGDWITEDKVPDPTPLPRIPGWHVLIRPVPLKTMSKGGIIIPEVVKDDLDQLRTVGRVLAVGALAYADEDFRGRAWCKVGDYVAYGRLVGSKFQYKGVKLLLLADKDIRMVVDDPADLL
jgi:co-chaperonin GroES (HSP10)